MTTKTAVTKSQEDDTAEEIIGILTAISVVSKRLAKKLSALEQATENEEGGNADVTRQSTKVR